VFHFLSDLYLMNLNLNIGVCKLPHNMSQMGRYISRSPGGDVTPINDVLPAKSAELIA
jgi:hypothetical protein